MTAAQTGIGAAAWLQEHPGWTIDDNRVPVRLRDPGGTVQATGPNLDMLLAGLEFAERFAGGSEAAQQALLGAEFGGWSIVVCDGEWEATRLGINPVKASSAWLLGYLLWREERRTCTV